MANDLIVHLEEEDSIEKEVAEFLKTTVLFRGPDPEIMTNHQMTPRSPDEERALSGVADPITFMVVRNRLQTIVDEAKEMLEHICSAPAAKWGDLICCIYTANGDMAMASAAGVLLFAILAQHPVKYTLKYWKDEPTVGIRPGDIFMHNDARFGNIHNTDQSTFMPLFHDGKIVAWAGAIVHEGENGACEPGGMPSAANSPFDEGLKISPMKVGENYELRADIVTYFQNNVRDPKLQFEDMMARKTAVLRVLSRVSEVIEDVGPDVFVAAMRHSMESTEREARRRISEWNDGTVRSVFYCDNTLREGLMVKINCALTKKGDELYFDFRGSSPEFLNRPINTVFASMKGMIGQLFLNFVWPDLPRNQAVLSPINFIVDERSTLHSSPESPNAQSMMTFFPAFAAAQNCVNKFLASAHKRYTDVIANWYDMINGFIYGGITQHGHFVGNIMTDINGMGGAARSNRDGEHALAPIFCAMSDLGETELVEDEYPVLAMISKKIMTDNQGFGKFRGGHGHQMAYTMKGSPMWGWALTCTGSKYPNVYGLFGGYGCHSYPLMKVRGTNVIEEIRKAPEKAIYDIVDIMTERPFAGEYSTHHMGMQFELAQEGELYMIAQGCGGGYGDVLHRDPALVIKDLEDGLISDWVAWNIYRVVYDRETFAVDDATTCKAREEERKARLLRGVPFAEFEARWTKSAPPKEIAYYGCWDNPEEIYCGSPDAKVKASEIRPVMVVQGSK